MIKVTVRKKIMTVKRITNLQDQMIFAEKTPAIFGLQGFYILFRSVIVSLADFFSVSSNSAHNCINA